MGYLAKALLGAAAVLTASAFTGIEAHANPIYIGYSLNGGTTITDIGSSGNDGTAGTGGTTVSAGQFSIQLSGTGQAAGQPSSLFSNTLTVNSSTGGSIILYASEINDTSRAISFTTGFSNDSQSSISVIENSTLGLSNSKYSVTSPYALGSATVAPGAAMTNQTTAAPATLPALYSLTDAYTLNFGSNGGTVVATLSVTSVTATTITATAVPEPASMALLGAGLISVGLLRRRKV